MKVIIDSKVLLSALNQLAPAISKNTVMAVLETVLVKVKKDAVSMVATNMNITIIVDAECGSKDEFSMLLPFAEMLNICKVLVGPVTIDCSKSQIVATSAMNDKFKLGKAEDVTAFPVIPEFKTILTASVSAEFFNALHQAKKSLPSQEHLVLSHVCIDFAKDRLTVCATDSLTMYKESFPVGAGAVHQSLVSDGFINAVKDFQQAEITAGEKFICAASLNKKVIVRVSDSRYVDYPAVIGLKGPENCKLNKRELETAINKVLVFKNALNFYMCDFIFKDGTVSIYYYDQDYERGTEPATLSAEFTNDLGKITLNARQLQNVLSQVPDSVEEINLAIKAFDKPIFLSPVMPADKQSDSDLLLLIMPIMSQAN